MKKLLTILLLFSFVAQAQIHPVPDRGQSGVIRLKQNRGLPNSITTVTGVAAVEQAQTFTYSAAGQPNGAYGANTLDPTNFDNAAGTKSSSGVMADNDPDFTLLGKVESRDQEITTNLITGALYLRMTAGGRAIVMAMQPDDNQLRIGIVDGVETKVSFDAYPWIYENYNVSALIGFTPGYGDMITFGVYGFDVYVKFNGVEKIRFRMRFHIVKGKAAIKTNHWGTTTFTINHFARRTLYSNTDAKIFDVRDFGWKQGNTTGSITGGTNTLTVASLNGLAVGDRIIVEIGGEATFNGRAGGMRGTKGVGGVWPLQSYANLAAMQADNTHADEFRAWNEDTGDIYVYYGGSWIKQSVPNMIGAYANETEYYSSKALPKAFKPTITAINGLVLTLDANAVVSTTNANVYFDNTFILTKLLQNSKFYDFIGDYPVTDVAYLHNLTSIDDQTGITVQMPAGTYAVGETIFWGKGGITLKGAGINNTTLFSPDGTTCFDISCYDADNITVEDFKCIGNFGLNGFGGKWDLSYVSTPGIAEQSEYTLFDYPYGIIFTLCDNVIARNVYVKDIFLAAFGTSICTNVYRFNITLEMTAPTQRYLFWLFQDASSNYCVYEECHFISPYITKAFEAFLCVGTQYINCTSINGLMSFNNSGNYLVDNFTQTFTANSKPNSVSVQEPCININTNYGNYFAHDGEIRNVTIIFEDYIDDNNDLLMGVVVQDEPYNILISGGSYTAPDYGGGDIGPQGIMSTGPSTTIDGFTVTGSQGGSPYFYKSNVSILNGAVLNSVAEYFHVGASVTYTNNTGTKVIVP